MGSGKPRGSGEPHIALLRAINVGGKNRLPMATLVRLFEQAGCTEVRTYIQSGNVVYRARPHADMATTITSAIAAELGLEVPVVTRTASQLRAAVRENPFIAEGADPAHCHVAFLADRPNTGRELDPHRSPGDRFELRDRELYLHLPGGVGRSKLTSAYLDRTLGTASTIRNWRTVLAILALAEA